MSNCAILFNLPPRCVEFTLIFLPTSPSVSEVLLPAFQKLTWVSPSVRAFTESAGRLKNMMGSFELQLHDRSCRCW